MALTKKEIVQREQLRAARSLVHNVLGGDDGGTVALINAELNKFERDVPAEDTQIPPEEKAKPKAPPPPPPPASTALPEQPPAPPEKPAPFTPTKS